MNKPFGQTLYIDLYNCKPGVCDDLELSYRFLEDLVRLLNMTPMAPPYVIHAPKDKDGNELFPSKAGVSGWVPLIESGIQIHTIKPKNFISIDVYTCGELDIVKVVDFVKKTYGAEYLDWEVKARGTNYNK